jgi:hypothetical protein
MLGGRISQLATSQQTSSPVQIQKVYRQMTDKTFQTWRPFNYQNTQILQVPINFTKVLKDFEPFRQLWAKTNAVETFLEENSLSGRLWHLTFYFFKPASPSTNLNCTLHTGSSPSQTHIQSNTPVHILLLSQLLTIFKDSQTVSSVLTLSNQWGLKF